MSPLERGGGFAARILKVFVNTAGGKDGGVVARNQIKLSFIAVKFVWVKATTPPPQAVPRPSQGADKDAARLFKLSSFRFKQTAKIDK